MNNPRLGRREDAGRWMRRTPRGTMGAVFFAVLTVYLVADYRYAYVWTPLQRAYAPSYLTSAGAGALSAKAKPYMVLHVNHRNGGWMARNEDLQSVQIGDKPSLIASRQAEDRGAVNVQWQSEIWLHEALHEKLRTAVYDGQSLTDLGRQPLLAGLCTLVVGLVFGIREDVRRARQRRLGKKLQGSTLVDVATFNSRLKGDGMALRLTSGQTLRLPRSHETSHYVIGGDTGVGKSTAIRYFLEQIERNV